MDSDSIILQMHRKRLMIFKAQDPENSHFDVIFEVEGRKIYANKYVLETISAPFYAMFSEQWKSKDDVIKLETYKFDDFYRFLTFFYSGTCELTPKNASIMVDIAEFYHVTGLKEYCDVYVSKMEYNMDNIFDLLELAIKYSLPKSKIAVDKFIRKNYSNILQLDQFINLKKSCIEYLVSPRFFYRQEEELYDAVYRWAEYQYISDEDPLKCENETEGIKAKMVEFLPYIKFNQMNPGYFSKYVVARELFTGKELSGILGNFHEINVFVCDGDGRELSGDFVDTFNVYDVIKKIGEKSSADWCCYKKPHTPSDLKKNESVQFYFVLSDRRFQVKKTADINDKDYLLCEMVGNSNFVFDNDCYICVSHNYLDE